MFSSSLRGPVARTPQQKTKPNASCFFSQSRPNESDELPHAKWKVSLGVSQDEITVHKVANYSFDLNLELAFRFPDPALVEQATNIGKDAQQNGFRGLATIHINVLQSGEMKLISPDNHLVSPIDQLLSVEKSLVWPDGSNYCAKVILPSAPQLVIDEAMKNTKYPQVISHEDVHHSESFSRSNPVIVTHAEFCCVISHGRTPHIALKGAKNFMAQHIGENEEVNRLRLSLAGMEKHLGMDWHTKNLAKLKECEEEVARENGWRMGPHRE